jgi:hypothetical protein
MASLIGYRAGHVVVNVLKGFFRHHVSVDHGLVGDDKNTITRIGQPLQCIQTSGNELEFGPALDIVSAILVDDPVPVQKNGFQGVLFSQQVYRATTMASENPSDASFFAYRRASSSVENFATRTL